MAGVGRGLETGASRAHRGMFFLLLLLLY